MSNPLVPVIQNASAILNDADTATLLATIFTISPLPATKAESSVRSITINLKPPVAPATAPTSSLNVQFNA